ncbi:conserved hypothetical protein [Ehrlichia chaffeensis str. Arkansas]|uniref:Uncharacterized protein n=3 Tax=Ehrlichia chaffeensis TaxID=945 RepID=Q2GF71_EHRCR|nr:unknown function UN3 [Ehrlichia chaffeensis]ABD45294.1 conserved hypothetical protein [Ehrlichia chaffeensis str. Arkansas]AHX07529.1 hypothetical protein ECHOSC_0056 [Ehrlichia chaffeensis str. Osceola]
MIYKEKLTRVGEYILAYLSFILSTYIFLVLVNIIRYNSLAICVISLLRTNIFNVSTKKLIKDKCRDTKFSNMNCYLYGKPLNLQIFYGIFSFIRNFQNNTLIIPNDSKCGFYTTLWDNPALHYTYTLTGSEYRNFFDILYENIICQCKLLINYNRSVLNQHNKNTLVIIPIPNAREFSNEIRVRNISINKESSYEC